ncbi:MAG: hypothetical protein ACR2OX_04500, partial [Methyloligellaceae bacterium]
MSEQADGNSLDAYVTSFTASSEPLSSHDGLVIVGKGTRLTGTIQSCQLLDVHGVLEADVVTDRLIVRDG